ncbi:MAG: DUF861 domain-containing protein [Caulobacterales bacterium]|nr:DUF861 domain-containing protein [Caulobacterales bacterium]
MPSVTQDTRVASAPVRTRTFIDLRRFAAEAAGSDPAGRNSWLDARRMLDLAPGPVSVAALSLEAGRGAVERLPGDEFILVLSGDLVIEAGGLRLALGADWSAVLPAGCSFAWRTSAGARVLVMRHAGPTSEAPGSEGAAPRLVDPTAARAPSNPPLADLLVGPTPQCHSHTDYRSADGAFSCGTWDSTPYHRRPMVFAHYELMHLLDGAVSFEDSAGRRGTFSAGDIVLMEQGAECSWLSTSDVAKVWAIYRPA